MLSYKLLFLISLRQNSLLQQRNLISELGFCSKRIQESIGTGQTLFSPDLLPWSCYKESVTTLHSYFRKRDPSAKGG